MSCRLFPFPILPLGFALLCLFVSWPCLAHAHERCPSHLRYTVKPGVSTPIYLKAPGGALCHLRREASHDADDAAADDDDDDDDDLAAGAARATTRDLTLVADAAGNLRFNVEPSADAEPSEIAVVLRCEGPAKPRRRIVLRAAHEATRGAPFPPSADPALQQPVTRILPEITDPSAFTDDELVRAGYPLRPDAVKHPSAYAIWLDAVSRPIKIIEPQTVSNPRLRNAQTFTKNSSNWSGFELIPFLPNPDNDEVAPYVEVSGHWIVPHVTGELVRTAHSSMWVGLDGDSQFAQATDLVQAGTEQEALPLIILPPPVLLGQHPHWNLTSTYAWTEVLPLQPVESVIANFPVSPGDGILCWVWVGAAGPNQPTTQTTVANFQLYDSNTGFMTTVQSPIETFEVNIHFKGVTAEWVMERPGRVVNGQLVGLSDLSNYRSQCTSSAAPDFAATFMDGTFAAAMTGPGQYAQFDFRGPGDYDISMVSGTHLLSAAYAFPQSPDTSTICFGWFDFQ